MRSPIFVFVILGSLTSGAHVATAVLDDTSLDLTPRGNVFIRADAEFTEENGVVSGSGTPTDPFVISGWLIVHTGFAGILLENTNAHVIIERIVMTSYEGKITRLVDCVEAPTPFCTSDYGIDIQNAANVLIRNVRIESGLAGIRVFDSERVTIERAHIGREDVPNEAAPEYSVLVRRSAFITVSNSTLVGQLPGAFGESKDINFLDNHVSPSGSPDLLSRFPLSFHTAKNLTVQGNEINHTWTSLSNYGESILIAYNKFQSPRPGFSMDQAGGYKGLQVCGNEFRGNTYAYTGSLAVENVEAPEIWGNRFDQNAMSMTLFGSPNATFRDNVVTNTTKNGIWLVSSGSEVHGNVFVDSGEILIYGPANATGNWWGDASGPSLHGPGTGVPFYTDSMVDIAPWLTSTPSLEPYC